MPNKVANAHAREEEPTWALLPKPGSAFDYGYVPWAARSRPDPGDLDIWIAEPDFGLVRAVSSHGGWDAVLEYLLGNQPPRVRLSTVTFFAVRDDASVTAPLRKVKQTDISDLVRQELRRIHREEVDSKAVIPEWSDRMVADLALRAEAFKRAPRPGRKGRDDLFYAQVALQYEQLGPVPNAIVQLAEVLGLSRGQAGSIAAEARKRGVLTSNGRGRPGGCLSPKGREVLDAARAEEESKR